MGHREHVESVQLTRKALGTMDDVVIDMRLDAMTSAVQLAVIALGEYPADPIGQEVMSQLSIADEALHSAHLAFDRANARLGDYLHNL